MALRPVLPVQENLSHIHQLNQEDRAKPNGTPGARLHRVTRHRHTTAPIAHTHHLLLGVAHLVPAGGQQRLESKSYALHPKANAPDPVVPNHRSHYSVQPSHILVVTIDRRIGR